MGGAKGAQQGSHASLGVLNLLLAKALRAPLWLLLSAALARVLEPQGLGTWSMILAAAMFLNQSLLHWTQAITQRFGRGEWLETQVLGRTFSLRALLLIPGLAMLGLLLLIQPFDWAARFYGLAETEAWFVLPMVIALWLMAEVQGVQQVREHFGRLAWSPLFADVAMLGTLAGLAWYFQGGAAEHRQAVFLIFSLVALSVWLLWLLIEMRGIGLRWQAPDRHALRQAAHFAAPLIPGFLIGYLAEWGDYFLIRHFYSETEVGFFHPAYQYLLIMIGLPTALASVILPKLVAASDYDGGSLLRRLLTRHAAQFGVLWGLGALMVAAVLPALFAFLVGGRYPVSVSLLQVMAIAIPGAVFQHVYGAAYFVQGRLGVANVLFFGIKIALNLALSSWLLPRIGVLGSAIGCAVSYLVLQWLFVFDQHRFLKIRFGNAECSLLFLQLAGIILFFANDLAMRLLVASLALAGLLLWARRAGLFSREEIDRVIPPRLGGLARPVCRLLCR